MGYQGPGRAARTTPWLIVDFETTARDDIDQFADDMRIDRRLTDPEKIKAAKLAKLEKAATDIDYARIVCSGLWASTDDGPTVQTGDTEAAERAQLVAFWDAYDGMLSAGGIVLQFNGLTYDLPLAMRRSQMHGLPYPAVDLYRYQKGPHVDLLKVLTFDWTVDRDKWKGLDVYARLFGIHIPDPVVTIDGKEVTADGSVMPALIAAGQWEAVRAHNLADLQRTAALAARLGVIRPAVLEQAEGAVA